MADLRVGDRVQVEAQWSGFFGQVGVVTQVAPHVMVLFDEYEHPIRIGAESLGRELS